MTQDSPRCTCVNVGGQLITDPDCLTHRSQATDQPQPNNASDGTLKPVENYDPAPLDKQIDEEWARQDALQAKYPDVWTEARMQISFARQDATSGVIDPKDKYVIPILDAVDKAVAKAEKRSYDSGYEAAVIETQNAWDTALTKAKAEAEKKGRKSLLYEVTADLYEIADGEETPKQVWKRHGKYLDRLATLEADTGEKA